MISIGSYTIDYMKRITLEEIELKYKLDNYQALYNKVIALIDEEKIKPVKASKLNGKKPALYKAYWIIEEREDNSVYIEELSYKYAPCISTDYYLNHIKEYKEDRQWALLLNNYLKNHSDKLKNPQSMNERSFAIWHREKFLKEEQGKRILKRCGINIEKLNIYETTEPLAYYVQTRETPQNMLIVENKDTFYSMRRRLMSSNNKIMGVAIGTLIYGSGKSVFRSFKDFSLCVEPHMTDKANSVYYFGDIDYEGIIIYEKLAETFKDERKIKPFCEAYENMLSIATHIGIENMPEMKEGQNSNIRGDFFRFFSQNQVDIIKKLLDSGKYIPQEILSEKDF